MRLLGDRQLHAPLAVCAQYSAHAFNAPDSGYRLRSLRLFALQEALRKYSVVPVVTRNLNTVSRMVHWWLIGSCRHCVGAIGSYQCLHTNEDVAAAHAVEAATLAHPLIDSPRAVPALVLVQDDELLGHRIPKGSWIIVHVQVGGTGAVCWLCVGATGAAWDGAF